MSNYPEKHDAEKNKAPENIDDLANAKEGEQDTNPITVISDAEKLLRDFNQAALNTEYGDKKHDATFQKAMAGFSDRARKAFRNLIMGIIVAGSVNFGPGTTQAAMFSNGMMTSDIEKKPPTITERLEKIYNATVDFSEDARLAIEGAGLFLKMEYYAKTRENGKMNKEEIKFRERIAQNIQNVGYFGDMDNVEFLFPNTISRVKQFLDNKKEYSEEKIKKTSPYMKIRVDMFRKYLGLESFNDSIKESSYKPAKSKDNGVIYYSFNKNALLKDLKSNWNSTSKMTDFDDFIKEADPGIKMNHFNKFEGDYFPHLGTFKMDVGYDDERKEKYISYYDKWDVSPPDIEKYGININSLNFPFEMYDRIYESDLKKY
ncbi:MAG: hypothetical protein WAV31_03605 [Candidatus Moraniibacteriota bacterium]